MIHLAVAAIIFGAQAQDPVVATSRSDSPATHQTYQTSGFCGGLPVSVTTGDVESQIIVSIGSISRDVQMDLPALRTGPGERWIARTYILCRADGGLEINLLFADGGSGEEVAWSLAFFKVNSDLSEVQWGAEHVLSMDEAALAVR